MKQFFLLMICSVLMSTATFAQKYGHLNSGNLVSQIPDTKSADEKLATFQKQLFTSFENKVSDFRTRGNAFMQEAQSGALNQIQIQSKQAEFQKEQEKLAQEEQEIFMKVQEKRKELLGPILERVDKAIKSVGKENGYTMIFDTSIANTVLFADDSDDVTALVKQKLGI